MGSGASTSKANTPDIKGTQNNAVKDGTMMVEGASSARNSTKIRAVESRARLSRKLHNETKRKITRELSCAPQNRATAQRTRAAERLASKNTAFATAKGTVDEDEDNEEAHALADYLISISPFNRRWEVLKTLSEGTFGVVFTVQDIITKTPGVIKVAKSMPGEYGNQTAEWEQFVLEKMFRTNPKSSIVRILDKGMLVDQNGIGMEFMVLEKAELDVKTYIYEETNPSLRRVRVCHVAMQFLKGIYDLHMQGLLHRDLKPDNMGICSREQPIVLIFDLGMARMYTERDGALRQPRTVVQFRGTPEWASGNASKNREQSRFDDLVAWMYIVAELFDPVPDSKQPLPWSYCENNGAVRYLKSAYCPARLLLRNCPSQFYAINTYLQSAHRYKAPKYEFIADRLLEAIEECKNGKLVTAIQTVEQS